MQSKALMKVRKEMLSSESSSSVISSFSSSSVFTDRSFSWNCFFDFSSVLSVFCYVFFLSSFAGCDMSIKQTE